MINPRDYTFSVYSGSTGLESLPGGMTLIICRTDGDGDEDPDLEAFLAPYQIFPVLEDTFETLDMNAKSILIGLGFVHQIFED